MVISRAHRNIPWGMKLSGGKSAKKNITIDYITVGSPAYRCGLKIGDEILAVDGDLLEDTTTERFENMAANKNTEMVLQLLKLVVNDTLYIVYNIVYNTDSI